MQNPWNHSYEPETFVVRSAAGSGCSGVHVDDTDRQGRYCTRRRGAAGCSCDDVTEKPLMLSATGFGRVEPVNSWNAVSPAEGRVIKAFPNMAAGTVVDAGDLLVQIDPTDYELMIAKTKANIAAAEATLAELAQQEENTRRLLEVQQRIFEVAKAEFDRVQTVSQNGTVTNAAFGSAQKTLLNQQNAVINLSNTLALFPAQRASAEATLSVREAECD